MQLNYKYIQKVDRCNDAIYLKYQSPTILIPVVPAIILLFLRAPAVEIYQLPSGYWLRFLLRRLGRFAWLGAEINRYELLL